MLPGESPRRFPGAGGCSGRHRGDAGVSGRARRRVRRAPSVPYMTPVRSGAISVARRPPPRPPPPPDRVAMLVPPSRSGKEPVAPAETAASAVGAGAHAPAASARSHGFERNAPRDESLNGKRWQGSRALSRAPGRVRRGATAVATAMKVDTVQALTPRRPRLDLMALKGMPPETNRSKGNGGMGRGL